MSILVALRNGISVSDMATAIPSLLFKTCEFIGCKIGSLAIGFWLGEVTCIYRPASSN